MKFDRLLQEQYPDFDWGEPITIRMIEGGEAHYACRLCLSRYGLKGPQIPELPTDIEEVRKHIRENHVIHKVQGASRRAG